MTVPKLKIMLAFNTEKNLAISNKALLKRTIFGKTFLEHMASIMPQWNLTRLLLCMNRAANLPYGPVPRSLIS